MKKIDTFFLGGILILYLFILFFFKNNLFTYKFDKKLISRYLCSQDIPYEPPCPRVWLSDEELHIAAGYLYATGSDPAVIDFQHTPFVAYLYGYSVLLFNNPYYVEILFGILLITLVYFLGTKMFNSSLISLLACSLLLIDPLFLELSSQASYELGQAVFMLLYLISMLYYRKKFLLQGIALGLMCSSKFWGAALFFVAIVACYKIIKREFNIRLYFLHFITAFLVFSLTYLKTFLNHNFLFNIIYFQLKIFKYWLDHSITNIPFASFVLFITGFFKSWWGNNEMLRTQAWSMLWPISLIASIWMSIKVFLKERIILKLFFSLIPFLYLIYLGVQAPFSRYFILILPFCYLSLSFYIIGYIPTFLKLTHLGQKKIK